ncbi:MAG TPA: hypothetical protein VEP90_10390 [Methylomirabilota bacterium]|nr:hypothetical protein [Methylomirabilota bacterium]
MTASANPGSTFISRMLYPEIVNLLMIPVSLNFLTGLTVVSDIPICLAISTNGVQESLAKMSLGMSNIFY